MLSGWAQISGPKAGDVSHVPAGKFKFLRGGGGAGKTQDSIPQELCTYAPKGRASGINSGGRFYS